MLVKFNRIGNEHSDATSDYEVVLDGEYPVKEFIKYLITQRRDEFGSVTIKTESKDKPKLTFKKDETKNSFGFENYLDKIIKSIKANGVWGQLHYHLTLDSDNAKTVEKMDLFDSPGNVSIAADELFQRRLYRDRMSVAVPEYHKNLADTFIKYLDTVRFEIESYVDRMTKDSTMLCELITETSNDYKLKEQIIIDKTDYTEEQFNLLAKVLGCTDAKEQITIYALDVKSV